MKLEYNGCTITQNDINHHVMVSRNGKMLSHAQCTRPLSEDELKKHTDFVLEQSEHFDEYWDSRTKVLI